ncbi:MAG: ester cyclase [Polyangiaceae bacterium]|nr:ester cyclase [Polyangiaceae bacterium]
MHSPAVRRSSFAACSSTSENVSEPTATAVPTMTSDAPPQTPTATATATTAAPPAPAPKLDLEAAVKKYVDESAAAWAGKDAPKLTALYAADGAMVMHGPRGTHEAKPADAEKQLAGYFAAFPDAKVTYTRVVAQGSMAVAEWVFTGTHKADFMGQKATNKKTGYKGVSVVVFSNDGKVKRDTAYFDAGTMMGQLGLGPKGQPVRPVEATPTVPAVMMISKASDAPASDAAFRAWLSANEKGDAKAVLALAADDVVISSQYMPADTKSKKALEKELAEAMKAFVDQKNTIAGCVAVADLVACEYTWQATWKGPAMGMKPTGKTGSVHSLEVGQFKDGKLVRAVGYANGAEFAASFGLMDDKAKPGAEAKKPEAAKPEAAQPDATKPEAKKP